MEVFFQNIHGKKHIHSKLLWIEMENINRTYSIKFWIINDNTHIVLLYSFVKQNVVKLVILTSVSGILFTWGLFWHFKALYILMHRFCSCCSCCATAVFLDILKSKKPKSDTQASWNVWNKKVKQKPNATAHVIQIHREYFNQFCMVIIQNRMDFMEILLLK